MPRSLLPPRGIFAGTRILFAQDLSAPVKETLLQLMALSWGSDSHATPVLTYPLLEHLTGKNARTLRGHLAALRTYQAALRLQPAGPGQFIICLSAWLFSSAERPPTPDGKSLPAPVNEDHDLNHDHVLIKSQEQEESPNRTIGVVLPPDDQSAQMPAPALPRLSRAVEAKLREAGVFPALMPEIAARATQNGCKDKDLLALLAWCTEDQPDRPASLFVVRMRAGARAPANFYKPPCHRCGLRGKHSPECPQRYALPDGY